MLSRSFVRFRSRHRSVLGKVRRELVFEVWKKEFIGPLARVQNLMLFPCERYETSQKVRRRVISRCLLGEIEGNNGRCPSVIHAGETFWILISYRGLIFIRLHQRLRLKIIITRNSDICIRIVRGTVAGVNGGTETAMRSVGLYRGQRRGARHLLSRSPPVRPSLSRKSFRWWALLAVSPAGRKS